MLSLYLVPSLLLVGCFSNSVQAKPTQDGVLPREQEYWDAFQAADIDADGFLDFEEFKEYIGILKGNRARQVAEMGMEPEFDKLTPQVVTILYSQWDKDGDHKLNWDEAKQAGR